MPDEPVPGKSRWERLLASTAFTAVVSLVGTGVVGNLVLAAFQNRARNRELAQVAYREHLSAELAVVKRAYELLGRYLSASEDLIFITGPAFHPASYAPEQRKQLDNQKEAIRAEYNKTDTEWRRERESLGFLMAYYHNGRPEVARAWDQVTAAVGAYNACAIRWTVAHPEASAEELETGACISQWTRARAGIQHLTESLDAVRRVMWKQWGVRP